MAVTVNKKPTPEKSTEGVAKTTPSAPKTAQASGADPVQPMSNALAVGMSREKREGELRNLQPKHLTQVHDKLFIEGGGSGLTMKAKIGKILDHEFPQPKAVRRGPRSAPARHHPADIEA